MLIKKQKRMLKFIAFMTIIVNLLVVLPFNSFGFKNAQTESLIKFLIAPIVIVLLMVYPHLLKHRQTKNKEDSSQIVAVTTFHPLLIYLVSIFLFGIHLITRYDSTPNSSLYTIGMGISVVLALIAYFYSFGLPRTQAYIPSKKLLRFDIYFGATMVVVSGLMVLWNNKLNSNYSHDTISLAIILLGLVVAFIDGYYYKAVFQKDGVYRLLTLSQARIIAQTAEAEALAKEKEAQEKGEMTEVVIVENEKKWLSAKQKLLLTILFGVSLFLSFLYVFPFNVVFGWYNFELVFKFFVLPVLIFLSIAYTVYLLYKQDHNDGIPQAIAVSVYLPFLVALISVCTFGIYLLFVGGTVNLGINVWGGLIAFYVIVLLVSVFLIFFFPRVQVALRKREHVIADVTLVVIYLCVHAITAILFTTFKYVNFELDFSALFLFVFFALYVGLAVLYYLGVLRSENLMLEVPTSVREQIELDRIEKLERLQREHLERELLAQEKAAKEQEERAAKEQKEKEQKEAVVEKVVEVRHGLSEEDLKAMYDACYQSAYRDALETLRGFTFRVEPEEKVEEQEEQTPPEVVEQVATEGEEVVEAPKPKRPIKVVQPSFIDIINYAGSIPGVTFSVNEKQTNYRFMYNKQLFLLAINSRSGYNLHFLAEIEEIISMIIKYPDIFKAKTPKGENWFKLVNRGDFPEDVIFDIIEHSYEMLGVLEQRKKDEKERIKQIKKEAREAERAKLREAQKAAKKAAGKK